MSICKELSIAASGSAQIAILTSDSDSPCRISPYATFVRLLSSPSLPAAVFRPVLHPLCTNGPKNACIGVVGESEETGEWKEQREGVEEYLWGRAEESRQRVQRPGAHTPTGAKRECRA